MRCGSQVKSLIEAVVSLSYRVLYWLLSQSSSKGGYQQNLQIQGSQPSKAVLHRQIHGRRSENANA